MENRAAVISLAVMFFAVGCQESRTSGGGDYSRIDTPEGMIGYLQRQGSPAMKSVEVWDNVYGPGLKISTAHYEVFTTLLEPLILSQIPGFVESAYRAYNRQLPEPIEATRKFPVYLFAMRSQWEQFTKEFAGSQAPLYLKIKSGAYYLNGVCVTYNIGANRTFSVLGHEGWHQFNNRLFKYRLPSWLDEGIAMQFEISRYENGLFYFEPARNGGRLGGLKITLRKNKMIPLEQLVSMNPGEAIVSSDDMVTSFYSQAYALVRFLREDDYSKRLGSYHWLLIDGLKGNWKLKGRLKEIAVDRRIPLTVGWNRIVGPQLFREYISKDFEKIDREFTDFCKKSVYHVRIK